jgi:hypothetical protein
VEIIAATPLTNYESGQRCADVAHLRRLVVLAREGCRVQRLLEELGADYSAEQGRATLAWLLKYDLLRADIR